jgi:hypothetical protein
MRKLTEKEKEAIAKKYGPKYEPLFDQLNEILSEIMNDDDLLALVFITECLDGLLRRAFMHFGAEIPERDTLH